MSAETDILARLRRWQAHFGQPMGNGRANPDNDLWFLLGDAAEAIAGLRIYAKKLECNRAIRAEKERTP